MFIESSKDLLFVVLAFCVLWITVFVSWLLYYIISIVRDAEALVRQVRTAVEKIEEVAHSAHEKMERSAASFTLVAQAIKELITWGVQARAQKAVQARAKKATKK
jgi:hypothetical protein